VENFPIHEAAFCAFAVGSIFDMWANALCANRTAFAIWSESAAVWTKRGILCVYVVLLIGAYFLYTRHTSTCLPYSYSLFALDEYSIVLTNCAFHCCALPDFWKWKLDCHPKSHDLNADSVRISEPDTLGTNAEQSYGSHDNQDLTPA
jgi:hypothetical protein